MLQPPKFPFRWRDLVALEISPHRLRAWLEGGEVRRVLQGVYCSTTLEDSLELRASCAALVMPEHAVVCERSAAWLWGIDLHDAEERFTIPDLEVASLRGHQRVRRQGIYPGVRDLPPTDVTEVGGVKVTTPVRTALDLACLRGRWQALAVLDAFLREFEMTPEELYDRLPVFRGRRGVRQVRELIPLADAGAESRAESWTRAAIHDAALPTPETQIEIHEGGILIAALDMGYEHLRIAVEYDGEEFHGPDRAEHDESRRAWLKEEGWHVIVVRKHQLTGLALEAWLAELRRTIRERSARGKRIYARRPGRWVS